jgi:CelD/BcsL family acetyltransferase involved in cellulose biosynthesis
MSEPGKPVEIRFEALPELASLGAEWTLLDQHGPHSFFQSWGWIGPWLRASPNLDGKLLVRALHRRATIGLAILTIKGKGLHGLVKVRQAWLNASGDTQYDRIAVEHNGFASSVQDTGALQHALLDKFSEGALPVDELVLPGLGPSPWIAAEKLISDTSETMGFRRILTASEAQSGLAPLLSRNSRQQLNRAVRMCETFGPLRLECANETREKLDFFSQMKDLHRSSWRRRNIRDAFDNPHFEPFCRELIEADGAAKNVDLLRLTAGPKLLGILLNFRRRGVIYSYQSGLDDTEPDLRPGYVAHAMAIQHYAGNGQQVYDFLAGRNQLKQSLSTECYPLFWQNLQRPIYAFRLNRLARRISKLAVQR